MNTLKTGIIASGFIFLCFRLSAQADIPVKGKMAFIPAGKYIPMYSSENETVPVNAFYIDRFPVTNSDFRRFTDQYPEWEKENVKKLFADQGYLKHWTGNPQFELSLAQSPVVNVSWFAAQKYCECQGKRLPTIAEWEMVAEAGLTRPDGRNEDGFNRLILDLTSKLNPATLPAVGITILNYYGVWDMHGLVWEWTYDFNSALTTGESRGNATSDNTLFCGGGSLLAKDVNDYAAFLRFALRSSLKAKYTVSNVGFRCVKDAENPDKKTSSKSE